MSMFCRVLYASETEDCENNTALPILFNLFKEELMSLSSSTERIKCTVHKLKAFYRNMTVGDLQTAFDLFHKKLEMIIKYSPKHKLRKDVTLIKAQPSVSVTGNISQTFDLEQVITYLEPGANEHKAGSWEISSSEVITSMIIRLSALNISRASSTFPSMVEEKGHPVRRSFLTFVNSPRNANATLILLFFSWHRFRMLSSASRASQKTICRAKCIMLISLKSNVLWPRKLSDYGHELVTSMLRVQALMSLEALRVMGMKHVRSLEAKCLLVRMVGKLGEGMHAQLSSWSLDQDSN
ncbi:hypothetical protein TNCV_4052201 [Trichonephila clavipes]|nr:hypothetical protein TNCV_4052201 [Trichonephila clavipes]